MTLRRILIAALASGLSAAAAVSNVAAQQPTSLPLQPTGQTGWTFNVAPYLWLAHVNTSLDFKLPPTVGGTLSTDSSIGFGDLLSHLDFATMVAADAQYERFSFLTDFMYMKLSGAASQLKSINLPGYPSVPISGAAQASAGLNLNAKIWTLAGGYTVVQGDWGNFDVIGGFRYLGIPVSIDYNLALTVTGPRGNGAILGRSGNVSGSSEIWNGIGGFRGRIRLDHIGLPIPQGLFIPYYVDAGAGGSNLTWQIASGLGYHAGWADVSLTYRYLSFQQSSSAVSQHLSVGGPMLMANFGF